MTGILTSRDIVRAVARGRFRCAAEVEDLTPYDGIVIGGALYFGPWHEDAARLLAKHGRKLAERPPVVFALGPKTADPQGLAESRAQLDRALATVPEVEPRSMFPFNRMPASDARDWDAIDEWADDAATTLEPRALAGRRS